MDDSIIPRFTEFDILKDFEVFRDEIGAFHLPRFSELPDVGLYMDQVVSIIDKYFKVLDRDDDKPIITSSMVNNYVKMGIIPPPVKKRIRPGASCSAYNDLPFKAGPFHERNYLAHKLGRTRDFRKIR